MDYVVKVRPKAYRAVIKNEDYGDCVKKIILKFYV